MPSLMELVERVNQGESIEPGSLESYQESSNSAEKFLAHHAQAMLDLRKAHVHILQSLDAIDYSDQKVLGQFISITSFLGQNELRAKPMVRFGASAIGRRDYSLGLEAIQSALSSDLQSDCSFSADRENCLFVSTQYDRAAQSIGWAPSGGADWNNKQTRIAYVTSAISDDESSSRSILSFARHSDSSRYKLSVYSTESQVRRDKSQFNQSSYQPASSKRGSSTLEILGKRKISTWLAPIDCDLVGAAKALADQLIADKIDVVLFDASQSDPICAIVAGWNVGRVKINVCRQSPLYTPGLSSVVYFDASKWESDKSFWSSRQVDNRFILEGCDAEDASAPAPQRSVYGIPSAAVVLATASADLEESLRPEFVETIINILRAHPQAVYLLVGDGELSWQKRKFESAGVGKRVGYTGRRKDLPSFLRICDIYLSEFPVSSSAGLLQAMSVERPVVAIRWSENPEDTQAASLVGSEATVNGSDSSAYIERVSKLIREPQYRIKLGKSMKQRVEQHFSAAQTIRHIEQLCDQLIQSQSETAVDGREQSQPLAAVA